LLAGGESKVNPSYDHSTNDWIPLLDSQQPLYLECQASPRNCGGTLALHQELMVANLMDRKGILVVHWGCKCGKYEDLNLLARKLKNESLKGKLSTLTKNVLIQTKFDFILLGFLSWAILRLIHRPISLSPVIAKTSVISLPLNTAPASLTSLSSTAFFLRSSSFNFCQNSKSSVLPNLSIIFWRHIGLGTSVLSGFASANLGVV